jgi:putative membrane protein
MVDYEPKQWFRIALSLRGSVLPRLLWRTILVAIIGAAAAFLHDRFGFKIPPIAHTMIGVALGLLLVFRTNTSYDRYWEGRKLIGAMLNRCRDLVRQAGCFVRDHDDPTVALLEDLRRYVVAFYATAMQGLRGERDLAALGSLLTEAERHQLEPYQGRAPVIAARMTRRVADLHRNGKIGDTMLLALDGNITALVDCLGGCERIARTPVPFAYAHHIKTFVLLFCFTVPFAMVDALKWYTPLASAVLGFALMGIDEIGVEIEDPFGYDANDLPIDRIRATIDQSTREILDDARKGA